MIWRKHFIQISLGLLLTNMIWPTLSMADSSETEYTLKAIRSLNFARFTQWSVDAIKTKDQSINLCVLGDGIVQEAFEHIDYKTIGNKTLHVIHSAQIKTYHQCQAIYFSQLNNQDICKILGKLRNRPVLTIGDNKDFVNNGGMIQLEMSNGHINMTINLRSVQNAGLSINSRALKLAHVVNY